MDKLLARIKVRYPELTFVRGSEFYWSPKESSVVYSDSGKAHAEWSLLHEVGHALCGHRTYNSDVELLELESAAWEKAKELGNQFGYRIDPNHIEDCMDTYRDWLHQRSACPTCSNRSIQEDVRRYRCFNCGQTWTVTSSRFCRPYRRKDTQNKKSLETTSPQVTFS